MTKLIYRITMIRSKSFIIRELGRKAWFQFKILSKRELKVILPQVPNIGKSVFILNYQFGPCYIAWYKAFLQLGLNGPQIDTMIWTMNERFVTIVPKFLLHYCGKMYINGFRIKASSHVKRQQENKLHSNDWKIIYREINKNSFEIDIMECGLKKLAEQFDAVGLLPGICRMDYMLSNLMGNGFVRDKTLGDGHDCCNCHYDLVGKCDWSPEKGFDERK